MRWRDALATAVVVVTAWPMITAAQQARSAIVRPEMRMDEAVRQAERDAAQVEQAQRTERLIREAVRPEPRRPDLQHDVIQGIQQRALQRALRR